METKELQKQLEQDGKNLLNKAQNFSITTHKEYISIAGLIKDIKLMGKTIEGIFNPIVQKANEAHQEALDQKKKFVGPLVEAEENIKTKMGAWIKTNQDNLDSIPKIDGVSYRKTPTWKLTDLSKVNPKYLTIDEKIVSGLVTSLGKDAEELVGGIEVGEKLTTTIRL